MRAENPSEADPCAAGPAARRPALTSGPWPSGPNYTARQLRERGLAVSRSTVGRVLAEARIRPHKVRGWLNRVYDPAFWARAGAVCRLYLHPEPGTA